MVEPIGESSVETVLNVAKAECAQLAGALSNNDEVVEKHEKNKV